MPIDSSFSFSFPSIDDAVICALSSLFFSVASTFKSLLEQEIFRKCSYNFIHESYMVLYLLTLAVKQSWTRTIPIIVSYTHTPQQTNKNMIDSLKVVKLKLIDCIIVHKLITLTILSQKASKNPPSNGSSTPGYLFLCTLATIPSR